MTPLADPCKTLESLLESLHHSRGTIARGTLGAHRKTSEYPHKQEFSKRFTPAHTGDFEGLRTSVRKATAGVVETARDQESGVDLEGGTVWLPLTLQLEWMRTSFLGVSK